MRFSLDAEGNATANGTITGNGIDTPIGLAFTPWGELLVLNGASVPSVSRFTFDTSRGAAPSGKFQIVVPNQVGQYGVGWIEVVRN